MNIDEVLLSLQTAKNEIDKVIAYYAEIGVEDWPVLDDMSDDLEQMVAVLNREDDPPEWSDIPF